MVSKKLSELDKNEIDRAREIHKKSIFVNLIDSTAVKHWDKEYYNMLANSGVTLDQMDIEGYSFREALDYFTAYTTAIKNFGIDKAIIVRSTEDVIRAKKEGIIAFYFHTQHGAIIEKDEKLLEPLYNMGLRIFGLCYNLRNYIADGCNDITDSGLSAFGHKVVEKCNELGIVIDLSHVGHQSSLEAIELSKDPVIFSHSNANGVYKNRRNIRDDQIKAIAERNGVIGACSWSPMVKQLKSNEDAAYLEDMLDHVDYFVNMMGVDHVGLGIDVGWKRTQEEVQDQLYNSFEFNAAEWIPKSGSYLYSLHNWFVEDLKDASNWPKITEGLVSRGYSDKEILKILGENFMRVFKAVWDK